MSLEQPFSSLSLADDFPDETGSEHQLFIRDCLFKSAKYPALDNVEKIRARIIKEKLTTINLSKLLSPLPYLGRVMFGTLEVLRTLPPMTIELGENGFRDQSGMLNDEAYERAKSIHELEFIEGLKLFGLNLNGIKLKRLGLQNNQLGIIGLNAFLEWNRGTIDDLDARNNNIGDIPEYPVLVKIRGNVKHLNLQANELGRYWNGPKSKFSRIEDLKPGLSPNCKRMMEWLADSDIESIDITNNIPGSCLTKELAHQIPVGKKLKRLIISDAPQDVQRELDQRLAKPFAPGFAAALNSAPPLSAAAAEAKGGVPEDRPAARPAP